MEPHLVLKWGNRLVHVGNDFFSEQAQILYANLLVIIKRNKFENQRKLIEVFNLRSKVVTCFNTLQSCCYPQRFPIMFSAIISRFCYLAATKKPNYWRKRLKYPRSSSSLFFIVLMYIT